ncbi:hypothetical protein [Mediterraneibacter gnavus]|uniref:hypothetical protein n=1 Tax=Mediterraneibacter gnavus TaxID=33038 RepID=UPI0035680145
MAGKKLYKDYFNIDPKYYAAVTADLIESGMVSWKSFYPHETFVKLLEKTHTVLSGKDPYSLWVEGAYGTGKSHAALTVKSLLDATDEEVRDYFDDYGLSKDLCQKIIADKNDGRLITIHRIGSGSIRSDQDLILAVQDSIMSALEKNGITNRGEASLRDAALKWLEKKANHDYFNTLIAEEQYAWTFGGNDVDTVIERLQNGTPAQIAKTMREIITVAEDNGITALRLDIQGMADWIKNIISENQIKAILFVWDEFTEFFQNNPNSLTGFQTLAEISLSHPFYFMIVSHESRSLFLNAETAKKILDRFIPPIKIELPENMAFRLMAQAMKTTQDAMLKGEWDEYKGELTDDLAGVCSYITSNMKHTSTLGKKTVLSEQELQAIVPIHPYAALLLKHLSVAFRSNQRSMFDFIISNDMTDAKAFKWFINNYGPLDRPNLLTIDMLWDFFYGKGQNGLNDDVRVILDSYSLLHSEKMTPDEQQVLKTVLLLQAISLRISDVDLLKPNEQNVDLAFSGTGWSKGKARSIAEKLVRDGILFKRTVGGGKSEYTIANSTGDAVTIKKLKDTVIKETKTQDLITNADLIGAIMLPPAINGRYILNGAAYGNFTLAAAKLNSTSHSERFSVLVTFALNDDEAAQVKNQIVSSIKTGKHNLIYVDAGLSPMGEDLFEQYIESMAYSRYYAQNDKHRAGEFQRQAAKCLTDWKEKIAGGAFMLYSTEYPSGKRLANITVLQDEFSLINYQKYFYGLESYDVKRDLFIGSALAQGAECGATQTLKQTFKEPKLETALTGAWGVNNYWEDPTKRSLPIVQIKMKVEELIQNGFNSPSGRVCVADIYSELEQAPYGFRATNLAAFVMGFVLKEYTTSDYFWSNGSNSESMSVDKMKMAIANAMKQTVSPDKKYKPEYIVAMSPEQKSFLKCTSEAFRIPMTQCGSIESARDQVRISMKKLSFPIWSVKSILENVEIRTPMETLATVIDDYCGIANTANSSKASESDLADEIGRLVMQNTSLTEDLTRLLTNDMCRKGMLAYIDAYQGGALKTLAAQIGDGGAYLEQVKQKFNADAANWVWNTETANDKINDVILDYRIIAESAKSIPACCSIRDVVSGWNNRTNNIKIAYEALKKAAGDLAPFLGELHRIKQTNTLSDQNKEKFYSLLVSQREAFDKFYSDQIPYFRTVAAIFIDEMDTDDVLKLYQDIPTGQFTKSSTEYMTYVENAVKVFLQNQAKKRLKDLWLEKTGTKDPRDWSARYDTPILCMLEDEDRPEAKEVFAIMVENSPSERSITRAIEYLNRVTYYDKLANKELRDKCFMRHVVGDYGLMLDDVQAIREYLITHVTVRPYDWMDNSTVQNQIRMLAEKKYKTGGSEKVWAVVEKMDATELRHYLRDLISDNVKVGIEILKNK